MISEGVAKRHLPLAERFWARVQKSEGCWLWQGPPDKSTGYGSMMVQYRRWGAHRLSWALNLGPIPCGMSVLHRCDVRLCVKPEHLFLGTQADNMADMARKGRAASGDRNGRRLHPGSVPRGENHGGAKLTDADVRDIRKLLREGARNKDLAARFGVHPDQIWRIKTGRLWSHVVDAEVFGDGGTA